MKLGSRPFFPHILCNFLIGEAVVVRNSWLLIKVLWA